MKDRKKEQPRKTQNRHQPAPVQWSAKERVERVSEHNQRDAPESRDKPIKGMDIDLMNYTDI